MLYSSISAFNANITKPTEGEVWQRNQTFNASIEWSQGNELQLPNNFPKALDLYFVDATTQTKIQQLTTFDPFSSARWIFSPTNPVSTNLTDGNYKVLLVNSNNNSDVAYTPTFAIKGGPFSNEEPSQATPLPRPYVDQELTTSSSSSTISTSFYILLLTQ